MPVVIWFTGLPGSGKTTLAHSLKSRFEREGYKAIILDGDELRKTISKDLGFSTEDRMKHNQRVINHVIDLLDKYDIIIVSLVSPIRSVRETARKKIGKDRFIEVFLCCPLSVCVKRDPKGLYAMALSGDIKDFTGIHQKYEEPLNPDVILYTALETEEECLSKLEGIIRGRLDGGS